MTDIILAGLGQTNVCERGKPHSQNKNFFLSAILAITLLTASCTPTPTKPVLADSFFSGQAFLDANGNGKLDSTDTPVENATFIVTLAGGAEFGAQTNKTGNAFVTIPAMVEYPVTVRMEPPKDSTLLTLEPSTITLSEATGETATFLFQREIE
jgi:hypothetical protein